MWFLPPKGGKAEWAGVGWKLGARSGCRRHESPSCLNQVDSPREGRWGGVGCQGLTGVRHVQVGAAEGEPGNCWDAGAVVSTEARAGRSRAPASSSHGSSREVPSLCSLLPGPPLSLGRPSTLRLPARSSFISPWCPVSRGQLICVPLRWHHVTPMSR